ncbi:MAG: F0F1 ATP synthase subunit delta [Propionibacteriaceae bacterium]|jgi:F-type H+-transporting ATPase subunit delta|nr:F0F1 ATP synthase subunit delta [Propionibacteriaceae bacterium]
MNSAAQTRTSALDKVADAARPTRQLAQDLFEAVGLLDAQPSLRNALSDPTAEPEARAKLANRLFADRLSAEATAVVVAAAQARWGSASELVAGLDRQASRALIGVAQGEGKLDQVEEELFLFERLVAGDQALREALDDRNAPLAARQKVVAELLSGRADDVTVTLAQRAVAGRRRTFELTVDEQLQLAAQARQRAVARVKVARALDDAQAQRLRAALARQVGRDVVLQVDVDPSVLGGALVQVGDEIIDGTVSGRLAEASKQLAAS